MAETATRYWTVEEMRREGLDSRRYEIVDGELVELRGNDMHSSRITLRIAMFLGDFLEATPLGVALANQRFRYGDPRRERLPDVSVLLVERIHTSMPDIIEGAPDLAIEVISPSDEAGDVANKAEEYLAHGSREAWIVEPRLCTIVVLRKGEAARALDVRGTLETAVLPGFSLPLARLFAPPPTGAAAPALPATH